jgi:hypothetical protein
MRVVVRVGYAVSKRRVYAQSASELPSQATCVVSSSNSDLTFNDPSLHYSEHIHVY